MASKYSVNVGAIAIGGGAPVSIQSMTNTHPEDVEGTIRQVAELVNAGCDIVRVSAVDDGSVRTFRVLRKVMREVPLVADIHYEASMVAKVAPYVDKIRINPGTMRSQSAFEQVRDVLLDTGLAVRIGMNAGSLPPEARGGDISEGMCGSLAIWVDRFTSAGIENIVLSLKASDPTKTLTANRLAASRFAHPIHIGLTESGTARTGLVRSATVLALLLNEGIGDTIRISLATNPVEEVRAARTLLETLSMRSPGTRVTACPTCARTMIDVEKVALQVEDAVGDLAKPLTVAVMGCEVNGPGEAMDADLALIGTSRGVALYRNGRVIARGTEEELTRQLMVEIGKD